VAANQEAQALALRRFGGLTQAGQGVERLLAGHALAVVGEPVPAVRIVEIEDRSLRQRVGAACGRRGSPSWRRLSG